MRLDASQVAGVILCGGKGRRVGGRDKPLIEFEGRPLIEYVIDAISPCVGSLMISCNRSMASYERYGHRLVSDRVPFNGPLEGIVSALEACGSGWLLIGPGDTPRVTSEVFLRLIDSPAPDRVRVAVDGTGRQPLFCLLPASIKQPALELSSAGPVAVQRFLEAFDAEDVDCTDIADTFVNINTL